MSKNLKKNLVFFSQVYFIKIYIHITYSHQMKMFTKVSNIHLYINKKKLHKKFIKFLQCVNHSH